MSRKKVLDTVFLILFFVELSSNFIPARIHEAAGIIFIAGVVAHNVMNRNFYNHFLRGEQLNLGGKILIVYFSRVGNTNFPDNVDAVSGASLMLDDKK